MATTPVTDVWRRCREVDVVTLHCPLGTTTRHMMSRDMLGAMKPTAWLINTARGPLVDEAALPRRCADGTLEAAGLDVLLREPPDPANPLLKLPNVVLSPHNAAAPLECNEKMSYRAAPTCWNVRRHARPRLRGQSGDAAPQRISGGFSRGGASSPAGRRAALPPARGSASSARTATPAEPPPAPRSPPG